MSNYQSHRLPDFARELRDGVVQLHSCDYRNPAQLRDGPVLLVGAGNSGAEIAKELVAQHRVFMRCALVAPRRRRGVRLLFLW